MVLPGFSSALLPLTLKAHPGYRLQLPSWVAMVPSFPSLGAPKSMGCQKIVF